MAARKPKSQQSVKNHVLDFFLETDVWNPTSSNVHGLSRVEKMFHVEHFGSFVPGRFPPFAAWIQKSSVSLLNRPNSLQTYYLGPQLRLPSEGSPQIWARNAQPHSLRGRPRFDTLRTALCARSSPLSTRKAELARLQQPSICRRDLR